MQRSINVMNDIQSLKRGNKSRKDILKYGGQDNRFLNQGKITLAGDSLKLAKSTVLVNGDSYDVQTSGTNLPSGYTAFVKVNDDSAVVEAHETLRKTSYKTANGDVDIVGDEIRNIKLEGVTKANLLDVNANVENLTGDSLIKITSVKHKVITDGVFTVFNTGTKAINVHVLNISDKALVRRVEVSPKSEKDLTLSKEEFLGDAIGLYSDGWDGSSKLAYDFKKNIVICTKNDNTGFKIASGFNGVRSLSDRAFTKIFGYGKNHIICDLKLKEVVDISHITYTDGYFHDWTNGPQENPDYSYTNELLEIDPGSKYCITNGNLNICYYDSDQKFIPRDVIDYAVRNGENTILSISPSNARYVRLSVETTKKDSFKIQKAEFTIVEIPYELRSTAKGVKDLVIEENFKHYLLKRCSQVSVNEKLKWELVIETYSNEKVQGVCTRNIGIVTQDAVASRLRYVDIDEVLSSVPTFPYFTSTKYEHDDYIVIGVPKDEVTSGVNLENYVEWIKNNNFDIVFKSKQDEKIPLPMLDDIVVNKAGSNLMLSTGSIQAEMSLDTYTKITPTLDENSTYLTLYQRHRGINKSIVITDPERVNYVSKNKDANNGQFTLIEIYRQNDTLKTTSELSDKVGEYYSTLTLKHYDDLGVNVIETEKYFLEYDADGDLIRQELIR